MANADAKSGHKFTFMSPFKNQAFYVSPNITEIVPPKFGKVMYDRIFTRWDINRRLNQTMDRVEYGLYPLCADASQAYFGIPELY